MRSRRSQKGFTLVELAVVMLILGMIAAYTTPSIIFDINEKRANLTAQETQIILDAARSYRYKNGSWPGNLTCSNAIAILQGTTPPMLTSVAATNKYNSAVTTSCTAQTFSVDQEITTDWADVVVNALPASTLVNAATGLIRSTIGVPGTEPALDSKLSRIASGNADLNRMHTTLLMGGYDVNEAGTVNAQQGAFAGRVSAATAIVNGNLKSGSVNTGPVSSTSLSSGSVTSGSIVSNGAATVYGQFNAQGASQFAGRATFQNDIVINGVVNEGSGCSPRGAVAKSSNGGMLSCQNGIWMRTASVNPNLVSSGANCATYGKGAFAFDGSNNLYVCK